MTPEERGSAPRDLIRRPCRPNERQPSRFWLTYSDLVGRPVGVVILDSPSLPGATFSDGHEVEGDSATLIPPNAIGRMLNLDETGKIIRQPERWISKRAAASIQSLYRRPLPQGLDRNNFLNQAAMSQSISLTIQASASISNSIR